MLYVKLAKLALTIQISYKYAELTSIFYVLDFRSFVSQAQAYGPFQDETDNSLQQLKSLPMIRQVPFCQLWMHGAEEGFGAFAKASCLKMWTRQITYWAVQ